MALSDFLTNFQINTCKSFEGESIYYADVALYMLFCLLGAVSRDSLNLV